LPYAGQDCKEGCDLLNVFYPEMMVSISGQLDPIEFSVIVPLYNKEKSIRSTIESILNQTFPNFELIIVNDGSTDDSLKVAQSFNDPRIKIINKTNGGVSSARNLGIEISKNQYIVFLDADDLWLPFCLEEFCRLITDFPEAEFFCTNFNMTGKNLKGSDRRYLVKDYFYTSAYYLAKWSITLVITGCVAIRKYIFEEVGSFDQNLTHGEDIDMWERLATRFKLAKSERVTTTYRIEAENRASLIDERLKKRKDLVAPDKRNALSRSQTLYYGVQSVFDLRSLLLSGKNFFIIRLQIKYLDWVLRGIFFIVKVRILNISIQ
jgi:glycosyltransferase involved in cell wall biosynthesis